MFVSVSTRCFSEMEFAEACRQIVDLEYDRLEVWLDEESSHLKPSTVAANPEQFAKRYVDQNRIPVIAFDLAHDVPSAVFEGICRASKYLRVTQISVPSSPLGTPFNSEIDRLKTLVRIASAEGVRVSFRTERGRLSEDVHNAVELCGAVKGLGLTFDPSYFLNPALLDKVFEMIAPHTFHTHLRDSTLSDAQVQVGLGEVDFSALVAILRKCGYSRALSVDLIPGRTELSQRGLELRKLRMLIDSLL
ncbi:MAG: sugar phosphate isomerase/epimerase [Planctomycetota bacterium]|nr:MAG: sugar phosphate isomerase/epimerase [Planctomycetota bacterium]